MKLLFVVVVSLLVFNGCAAKRDFAQLPHEDADFKLPVKALEEKFTEINLYKKGNFKFGWCTSVEQLEEKWGTPDEVNTVWVQVPLLVAPIAFIDGITTGGVIVAGVVYTMTPKQPQHYIWKKGNYSIDAYVVTDIFCGYEKHVMYWDWSEVTK